MYIDNVLQELWRVANIAFVRGKPDDLRRLIAKLETLTEDAKVYLRVREKEEDA